MAIGKVAKETGLPAKTIRYYEESGLIPPAERAANGYRMYSEQSVHTLRFIKRARDLGFSVAEVSRLLALWQDEGRASSEVKALARKHLDDIDKKISDLLSLKATLERLVKACRGDHRPDCPILEDLLQH